MNRTCYAVIGIELPWQEYIATVTLSDGRRAACSMPAAFPPENPIPPRTKRAMWRACVAHLRAQTNGEAA